MPDFAPLVLRPSKVVCVGLNYRNHIQEMGRDLPKYPTLFCKFADALIGAYDDILRPAETSQFDWEAELAVVIGDQLRRAGEQQPVEAIAGFKVLNDVTCATGSSGPGNGCRARTGIHHAGRPLAGQACRGRWAAASARHSVRG